MKDTMFSLNGARSEGYVQELFHEEAQQVCWRAISLRSPSFHLRWSLYVLLVTSVAGKQDWRSKTAFLFAT